MTILRTFAIIVSTPLLAHGIATILWLQGYIPPAGLGLTGTLVILSGLTAALITLSNWAKP